MNVWSPSGELPLELALTARNVDIAATLVQHNANIDMQDVNGDSLLHRAIKREDAFAAMFLLENKCDTTLMTR